MQGAAAIIQRDTQRILARPQLRRPQTLGKRSYAATLLLDHTRSELDMAESAYNAAIAFGEDAVAAIKAANSDPSPLQSGCRH